MKKVIGTVFVLFVAVMSLHGMNRLVPPSEGAPVISLPDEELHADVASILMLLEGKILSGNAYVLFQKLISIQAQKSCNRDQLAICLIRLHGVIGDIIKQADDAFYCDDFVTALTKASAAIEGLLAVLRPLNSPRGQVCSGLVCPPNSPAGQIGGQVSSF